MPHHNQIVENQWWRENLKINQKKQNMIADLFPEKIAIQMMCNDIFKVLKKFPFKLEFYIQRKYISEVKENEILFQTKMRNYQHIGTIVSTDRKIILERELNPIEGMKMLEKVNMWYIYSFFFILKVSSKYNWFLKEKINSNLLDPGNWGGYTRQFSHSIILSSKEAVDHCKTGWVSW